MTRLQSTEYGGRKDAKTVQRWKSERRPPEGCKGGKVESDYRVRSTDYREDNRGGRLAGVSSIGGCRRGRETVRR